MVMTLHKLSRLLLESQYELLVEKAFAHVYMASDFVLFTVLQCPCVALFVSADEPGSVAFYFRKFCH